jgi:O-methyltransferase
MRAEHDMPAFSVRRGIQRIVRSLGYDIHRHRVPRSGKYDEVLPRATYAPWNVDAEFLQAYHRIQANSLVDIYRCFELWRLVEQSRKRHGALMEVGVWRGGTGALIALRAKLSGISDRVYLCDTFSGVVKASAKDSCYTGGEHGDADRGMVERLLHSLGLENATCLAGMFPEETAHLIQDRTLRFCHIDVDVYESARDVTEWVWPRLSAGGIVVYDDYGFDTCEGITRYVDEQFDSLDRIVLHNLNGHAIVVKTGC